MHGLAIAPIAVEQRAAFGYALTVGLTAEEFEPDSKAAEEITQLSRFPHAVPIHRQVDGASSETKNEQGDLC